MKYTLLFCVLFWYSAKLCSEDLPRAKFAWSLGEDSKKLEFQKFGRYRLTEKITAMPLLWTIGRYRIENGMLYLQAEKCDIDVSEDFRTDYATNIKEIRESVCNSGFGSGVCIFIYEDHAAYRRSIRCLGSDPNGSYVHSAYPLELHDYATRPKIGTEIYYLDLPVIAEDEKFMIMHRISSYNITASLETALNPKINIFIRNQYSPGAIVHAFAISKFMYAHEGRKCHWLLIRDSFGSYHWIPRTAVNGH